MGRRAVSRLEEVKAKARAEAEAFVKELNMKYAKARREERKKAYEAVVAKGEIVTYGDLFAVFDKLSWRAKRAAALNEVLRLSSMGLNPEKIIETMEPKEPARKGDDHE
jgi:hypothetical protein